MRGIAVAIMFGWTIATSTIKVGEVTKHANTVITVIWALLFASAAFLIIAGK